MVSVNIKKVVYNITYKEGKLYVLLSEGKESKVLRTERQLLSLGVTAKDLNSIKIKKTSKNKILPRDKVKSPVLDISKLEIDLEALENKVRVKLANTTPKDVLTISDELLNEIKLPFHVLKSLSSNMKQAYHLAKCEGSDEDSEMYKIIIYCYNNKSVLKHLYYEYLESVYLEDGGGVGVPLEGYITYKEVVEGLKPHVSHFNNTGIIEYELLVDFTLSLRNNDRVGLILKIITTKIFSKNLLGNIPLYRINGVPQMYTLEDV